MSVLFKLAYAQDRRDQAPNRALAAEIALPQDQEKLKELIELIKPESNRRLQMDAMLTIAYIGEFQPIMLVPHVDYLVSKLQDPIDRVGWGSMIALANAANYVLDELFNHLPQILEAMRGKSIVGKDHGFRILVSLYKEETYTEDLLFIILEQLQLAPSNQLGQYVERMIPVLKTNHKTEVIKVLEERREELTNPHHLRRLSRNLKKLYK